MLWIEKYRPVSFENMESCSRVIEILQSYSVDTIPHLIISGGSGHGKRTILYCLIDYLYGSKPVMKLKKMEVVTSSNKKLDVSFLESEEFIEIDLSEYGYQDRVVVQTIIKQIAQTKPMLNFFRKNSSLSTKILAITNAEHLTKDAQAALRRTIEVYSSTFRVILICSQLSSIIEPIRSRFLNIRMPGFSQKASENICKKVLAKEEFILRDDMVGRICRESQGNLKRALSLLEVHCFNQVSSDNTKRQKVDPPVLKLDWEVKAASIVDIMKREQSSQSLKVIRESIYDLLGACIPPQTILITVLRYLLKNVNINTYTRIVEYASLYDERLKLGTKSIVHLESFVASSLVLLKRKSFE